MNEVVIYTDGACSGNPGKGGYCAILIHGEKEKVISDFEFETTNNRMELMAVIKGLEALKIPCSVKLYSDSAYVINALSNGWLSNWIKNNWKTSSNKEVKNIDLWQRLYDLIQIHLVEFIKVKGHADNDYNNRCDKIATSMYKDL